MAPDVRGGGLPGSLEAADQDLRELRRAGLIETTNVNVRGTYEFFVTSAGYARVEQIRGRVDPVTTAAQTALDYIRDANFDEARHPVAHNKFRVAVQYAHEDPCGHATRIGHDCREALQAFAKDLVQERNLRPEKDGTFAALEAVVKHHAVDLGSRKSELLEALNQLWRAASGLAQRPGARREQRRGPGCRRCTAGCLVRRPCDVRAGSNVAVSVIVVDNRLALVGTPA